MGASIRLPGNEAVVLLMAWLAIPVLGCHKGASDPDTLSVMLTLHAYGSKYPRAPDGSQLADSVLVRHSILKRRQAATHYNG